MGLFSFKDENIVVGEGKSIARTWMIIASVVLGINLFLILTLLQMTPKLQVVAHVLTENPMYSSQFVQVEPFTQNTSDKRSIEELLVRYYMDARHNSFKDVLEMTYRWQKGGPVFRLSSPKVYHTFAENLKEKLKAMGTRNVTTSIRILNISVRQKTTYDIEFEKYTMSMGQVDVQRKNAVIQIAYSPRYKSMGRLPINPYGLYIAHYDETNKAR